MNKVDVPKKVSTPSMCVYPLGVNAQQMSQTDLYRHNELIFSRLSKYALSRDKGSLHFLTIRPSTSYICSRYFNNTVPSSFKYERWFIKKLEKLLNKYHITYTFSLEENTHHNIGVHAHIIFFNLTKKKFLKIYLKLRDYYTLDHKIMGSQKALVVSEKDYSNFKKGIYYFLGKELNSTGEYIYKSSFISHYSNITLKQIKYLRNKNIIHLKKEYQEFIENVPEVKNILKYENYTEFIKNYLI